MEHHLPLIGRSPLFANIDAADLAPMLQCLGARQRTFPKGSYLFRVGDRTTAVSYTHLDVYKRQAPDRACWNILRTSSMLPGWMILPRVSESVSK